MKNILYLIIFCIPNFILAQELEWQKQVPFPFLEGRPKNITFFDENNGIISGYDGFIYKTDDGGGSWELINSEIPNLSGFDMHFIDENHGIMSGIAGSILFTTDGGNNWVQRDVITNETLTSCLMLNSETFVAAGTSVYKTEDAGVTWDNILEMEGHSFRTTCFLNENIAWAAGSKQVDFTWRPVIAKTIDGGLNWEVLVLEEYEGQISTLYDIDFVDEMHGMACGPKGAILVTEDGGNVWEDHSTGIEVFNNDVLAGDISFVLNQNGDIFRSSDFGQNWEQLESENNKPLCEISQLAEDTYYSVGFDGVILKTINNGESWQKKHNGPSTGRVKNVHFFNELEGWAINEVGTVLHTINGGVVWEEMYFGEYFNIEDISFLNENIFWAVGSTPEFELRVIFTEDGGENWTMLENLGTGMLAWTIDCLNETTVCLTATIVGGFEAQQFRTTNGGLSWTLTSIESGAFTGGPINSVFTSETKGHLSTLTKYYETEDGGITWNENINLVPADLEIYVHFYDDLNGAVGPMMDSFGTSSIAITEDGGDSWNFAPIPPFTLVGSIITVPGGMYLLDKVNMSRINYSSDAGLNWEIVFPGNENNGNVYPVNDIFPLNESQIWVACDKGHIYYGSESTSGIKEETFKDKNEALIEMFPNPATSEVSIKLNDNLKELTRIELINSGGEVIDSYAPAFNQKSFKINLEEIPSASYFLRFVSESGIFSRKLIVE